MSVDNSEDRFTVCTPGTQTVVWEGTASSKTQVSAAVRSAREALGRWQSTSIDQRIGLVRRFAELARRDQDRLAKQISAETGKPHWEAAAEAKLVPAKVDLSIEAYQDRNSAREIDLPQGTGAVAYRGVGVIAVLGPFNFPAHLPGGHIVPAILAGNSVVFKPSEMTPGTGASLVALWKEAGLPEGVLQIVQGDGRVGAELISQDVDAVLFTGSFSAGCSIHRALGGRPHVLLALEMGGNNPIIVHGAGDLDAAAYLTTVSAFVTAGQRCTCARRLIVTDDQSSEALIERLVRLGRSLRVGMPDEEETPFMGPLISTAAASRVLSAQANWIERGGKPLLKAERVGGNDALLRPGLIDVTEISDRDDEEIFGPLLQLIRVADFDSALAEANRTRYGLSASLISDQRSLFEAFRGTVRAGVINWNQPTIGASGRLPFGGLGASGNHRPSGYFAADYCSDATALLQSSVLAMPDQTMPGIESHANDRDHTRVPGNSPQNRP